MVYSAETLAARVLGAAQLSSTPGVFWASGHAASVAEALAQHVRRFHVLAVHGELPDLTSAAGASLADELLLAAEALALSCRSPAVATDALRTCRSLSCSVALSATSTFVLSLADAPERRVRAAAAALDALGGVKKCPGDNRAAVGRALVKAGASVRDAAREVHEIAASASEDGCAAPSQQADDEDDTEYDATASASEAVVAYAALPLHNASLAILQPVFRWLLTSAEPAEGDAALCGLLDELHASYFVLAGDIESCTAALWPPQEVELIVSYAQAVSGRASGFVAAARAAGCCGDAAISLDALAEAVVAAAHDLVVACATQGLADTRLEQA